MCSTAPPAGFGSKKRMEKLELSGLGACMPLQFAETAGIYQDEDCTLPESPEPSWLVVHSRRARQQGC